MAHNKMVPTQWNCRPRPVSLIIPKFRIELETDTVGASRFMWIARESGLPQLLLGPLSHGGTLPLRTSIRLEGWGHISVREALAPVIITVILGPIQIIQQV